MDINEEKVDEISLALLYLTTFEDKFGFRAWKSHSWDVLDRLYKSGYIDDPKSKAKSVVLTDEGVKQSKALFERHFTITLSGAEDPGKGYFGHFERYRLIATTDITGYACSDETSRRCP